MKHWFSGLLAALMLFSLSACGSPMADLAGPSGSVPFEESHPGQEPADIPAQEDAESPSDAPDTDIPEAAPEAEADSGPEDQEELSLPEDGVYTAKEDVALYIYLYGRLPGNFITKKEAQNLGWPGGSLEPYAPGKCIGGSHFGNYEGLLPEAEGRSYTECDIDTLGAKSRGAKRIVFSNDGLIYYTENHYESFELLYGDESDD